MAVFNDPPTDVKVNSYSSLDQGNFHMARRLHTDAWDNATESPSARGYLVDDPGATLIIGSTTIPIDTGKGDWKAGNVLIFGDPVSGIQEYQIVSDVASPATSIDITPGLVSPVPGDNLAVNRLTPSEKETALIWATCVLDYQMDWFGSQRFASRGADVTSSPQQNLRWPRSGVVDLAGYPFKNDEFPLVLIEQTSEAALYLLQRDLAKTPDLLGLGFSAAEIPGPIKVKVSSLETIPMLPSYLLNKLRELGVLTGSATAGGFRTISMVRA